MPKRRLPYILRERSRHGRMRWYFRKGKGLRIRLPNTYGTPEFLEAYNQAISSETTVQHRQQTTPGTLEWLVRQWRLSSDWEKTSKATKRQRDNILRHVLDKAAHAPYTKITKRDLIQGMEDRRHTPFAANNFLKTLRALFRWACSCDLISSDPTVGVKMFSKKTDGFPAWTDNDVVAYRKTWSLGTRERLAMELLLWTGLRRGDAVRLGRQHVKDGYISLVMEKTSIRIEIPMSRDLATVIDASPTGDLHFLVTAKGQPMAKESFGNWFRNSCKAAGVQASAHGLRKLAAIKLAEAGATESQLSAVFGWRSNRQSEVYTHSANRRKLATEAIQKLKR